MEKQIYIYIYILNFYYINSISSTYITIRLREFTNIHIYLSKFSLILFFCSTYKLTDTMNLDIYFNFSTLEEINF